jgi:hypothetical protein
MATQIVMDTTGDSRTMFDPADPSAVRDAEARFDRLLRHGYSAGTRNGSGPVTITRTFDPAAEETLFYPRLVGG